MVMISTKNLVTGFSDVPKEWIFEYYLNLKERLTGQDVKMLSVFNARDKVPSMFIYFDTSKAEYKFKDFSSGYQGDCINLVMHLFNLEGVGAAIGKIIADYQNYLTDHTPAQRLELQYHDKYKVVDYEIRHWTNLDEEFWSRFKLGSKILEHYNVAPLNHFTMEKTEQDSTVSSFTSNIKYLYGYFRKDGSLYKIYMPKNTEKKFIKVENYIQGIDQLSFEKDYLVITSSLKDLMCFVKLGYQNIEAIAPDSENSMISETIINQLTNRYKNVCVIFDNDVAGIKSMERYKERYGLNYIILDMEKDLSDSVAMHGIIKVKEKLHPLLIKALKNEG